MLPSGTALAATLAPAGWTVEVRGAGALDAVETVVCPLGAITEACKPLVARMVLAELALQTTHDRSLYFFSPARAARLAQPPPGDDDDSDADQAELLSERKHAADTDAHTDADNERTSKSRRLDA